MSACWFPRTPARMTAAAFRAGAGNPAVSRTAARSAEIGSFASPPRSGFALLLKLERRGESRNVSRCRRRHLATGRYELVAAREVVASASGYGFAAGVG